MANRHIKVDITNKLMAHASNDRYKRFVLRTSSLLFPWKLLLHVTIWSCSLIGLVDPTKKSPKLYIVPWTTLLSSNINPEKALSRSSNPSARRSIPRNKALSYTIILSSKTAHGKSKRGPKMSVFTSVLLVAMPRCWRREFWRDSLASKGDNGNVIRGSPIHTGSSKQLFATGRLYEV